MRVIHEFYPVYDKNSRVLILGSLPSVKSREQCFYYGHPQNRFWKILAKICNSPIPQSINDKKILCLENHIALWDVIKSCDITGSSDSSIRDVRINNLGIIFNECDLRAVFLNGNTAYRLFMNSGYKEFSPVFKLPSTSPANAAWKFDRLFDEWSLIKHYLSISEKNSE